MAVGMGNGDVIIRSIDEVGEDDGFVAIGAEMTTVKVWNFLSTFSY